HELGHEARLLLPLHDRQPESARPGELEIRVDTPLVVADSREDGHLLLSDVLDERRDRYALRESRPRVLDLGQIGPDLAGDWAGRRLSALAPDNLARLRPHNLDPAMPQQQPTVLADGL